MVYEQQGFENGQILTAQHLINIENGILNIVTNQELFTDFYTDKDFFLGRGSGTNNQNLVIPILSTSRKAVNIVISLDPGASYTISFTNNGPDSSRRVRIGAYAEDIDAIRWAPAGTENSLSAIDSSVASTAIDVIEFLNTTAAPVTYTTTYTNNLNAKTLLMNIGWQNADITNVTIQKQNVAYLNPQVKINANNLESNTNLGENLIINSQQYIPWQGAMSKTYMAEQDYLNMTNILLANMSHENKATQQILVGAYDLWKHRSEFIYSGHTGWDQPWDYWTYEGYVDSQNTGKTVTAENAGYKRIDCSSFVYAVINGYGYYATPYYNTLEWTTIEQGGLNSSGQNITVNDELVCRTDKMYIRAGKRLLLESKNSSYTWQAIYGFDNNDSIVWTPSTLTNNTILTPPTNVVYLKAQMKVKTTEDYATPADVHTPHPILKCLRIREADRITPNAEIPFKPSGGNYDGTRYARNYARWFDTNNLSIPINYQNYSDFDIPVGSILFFGRTTSSTYKNITHITLYIGGGYLIHAYPPYGLIGGEGLHIHRVSDIIQKYTKPMSCIATAAYHTAEI